MHNKKGLCQS